MISNNRLRIRRARRFLSLTCDCHHASPEKPWVIYNLPTGTESFATWREAMDYATKYRIIVT